MGCTNVETGKPEYILLDTMDEIDYMRASASMPMVSQIVEVGGMKLLDGGVADSVPIRAFQQMGYEKKYRGADQTCWLSEEEIFYWSGEMDISEISGICKGYGGALQGFTTKRWIRLRRWRSQERFS